jgi:hypothetical protein
LSFLGNAEPTDAWPAALKNDLDSFIEALEFSHGITDDDFPF